jgi:hypothetical protein
MNRYERENKAYEFLKNNNGSIVSVSDLSSHSQWSEASIHKYLKQNWQEYVEIIDRKTFKPTLFNTLSYEDFRNLQSQSSKPSVSISSTIAPVVEQNSASPFSTSKLSLLFVKDTQNISKLRQCELFEVEYKQKFHIRGVSDYAKTIAAFANNNGGYFIFGVADQSKEIVGLEDNQFSDLKSHEFSTALSHLLSHSINWEPYPYRDPDTNRDLGIIYIHEASSKPVISLTGGQELKEGDIYYRYAGASKKIKYTELQHLIQLEVKRQADQWIEKIRKIQEIGVSNVGLLDIQSGQVSGSSGSFYIDDELLPKLKFIEEGSFSEKEGAPTLKLIGNLERLPEGQIQVIRKETHQKNITSDEIIRRFFLDDKVENPLEYVKAICHQNTGYLPVYFFHNASGIPKDEFINNIKEYRHKSSSKNYLLKRLKTEDILLNSESTIDGNGEASNERSKLLEKIKNKAKIAFNSPTDEASLVYFFQVIPYLNKEDLDWTYLKPIFQKLFQEVYPGSGNRLSLFMRKALCHVDKVMYRSY